MKYFIENRISAYMLFLALCAFGLVSYYKLPVSLMPQAAYPAISVIVEYPGISPEKIETIIVKPVEKAVKTVAGIEKIDSVSEEGKARINISFQIESDIKISALQVREKIGLIRDGFPREVQEPVVMRYDPSDRPVLIATVDKKGASLTQIRDMAEREIKSKLQRIEGISEINVVGGLQREIHINVDRTKFEARSLSFDDLFATIQKSNVALPGGTLQMSHREYSVYTSSRYKNIAEIADTAAMNTPSGSLIRIFDIGDVRQDYREQEDISRQDGEERVTIYAHKAGDANTLAVCGRAIDLLGGMKDFEIGIVYNQGTYVQSAVNNVITSCIWGVCIVIVVLILFMKKATPVITMSISIPITIIIVFAGMYFLKIGIDLMSLSGLAMGAGMIVTNGIIVTDSIYRAGPIDRKTILERVGVVKNAIIASTLATIGAFFPIVFGDIATRKMYLGLVFTIASALAVSLAVAIILIPALYAEVSENRGPAQGGSRTAKLSRLFQGSIGHTMKLSTISGLVEKFKKLLTTMSGYENRAGNAYARILDGAFSNRPKVLKYLLGIVVGTALLVPLLKNEYIDPFSTNEFYVYLEFPTGKSLDLIDRAVGDAEKKLKSMEIASSITTKVEKWRGTLSVKLDDSYSSKSKQEAIKKSVKDELGRIVAPGEGFVYITESAEINTRELDITFIGNENETLREIASSAARLVSKIPGVDDCVLRFREGRPEYRLNVDRQKAALSMLTPYDISQFLRSALFGPVVTKHIENDREVDVRIKFAKNQRDTIQRILGYSLVNSEGSMVPLKELVSVEEGNGPTRIWRHNGRRCVTITAKLGGISAEGAASKIMDAFKTIKFPEEYYYEFDESVKRMETTRHSMMFAVVFAVLFVYMILASQFESLTLPFIIMASVPLAAIGIVLMLVLTISSINISVYIGCIVLAGLAVNNGIILVDAINKGYRRREFGIPDCREYIKTACLERFRPVCITTLTTIMGLVPMLLKGGEGSNLWRPLSRTIISGMSCSAVLTLVLIPVLCTYAYTYYLKKRGIHEQPEYAV
ncbi:MAG: efflux RND transporter permease subunit [Spirochaetes bacterium]|nr:MAG: efflux RND transporter permease subunit [Spirochaetota bacterium]